jgi:hypothetical protein
MSPPLIPAVKSVVAASGFDEVEALLARVLRLRYLSWTSRTW